MELKKVASTFDSVVKVHHNKERIYETDWDVSHCTDKAVDECTM